MPALDAWHQKLHYYLRQLSDAKIKPVVEIMKEVNLKGYAQLCGSTLARAHARSGDPATTVVSLVELICLSL